MVPCWLRFAPYSTMLIALVMLWSGAAAQLPTAGFTVNQSSGCIPLSVQFTNTSQNAVSWYWDFGNGNYSTAQHPANIYLATGSFTVKLIAYNANGQADSLIRTGFINTSSPPAVDFSAGSTVACLESSVISFTNQSIGFDSCVWDFGDGVTSTQLNPVHQYSAPGLYTVTLVAYNNVLGCSASLSKNAYIHILSNPAATFTADVTTSCNAAAPITFTPQSSSANSWLWYFGDGTTSTQQQPAHIYGQPGVYTVTLITSNQLGCSDTVVMPGYIEVLANPVPVIISGNPLTGCKPVNLLLTSNVQNVTSWSWDFGDTTFSQAATPFHTYNNAGTYILELEVTYTNGCSNSDTVHVRALPAPVAAFSLANNIGCAPVTVNFTNTSTGFNNTYLWTYGDGTTSTQFAPSHTFTAPGTYYVNLTAVNGYGCTHSYTNPFGVTASQVDASFTADDLTGCAPHTVNFTHPGGGVYTYNWNFGDGTSSTQQSPSHVYQNNGTYTVQLTVSNIYCSASYTLSTPVSVTNGVNNFSPVTPVTACAPFTINLYDNSPGTVAWDWDFDDGGTSSLQDPVHTYTTSGIYNVTLQTQSSGTSCSQLVDPYGTYIIHSGEAGFSLTQTLCPPYTATFTDQSVNAVSWFWDFGDGTTSTQQHPVHVYNAPGSYNVSLTITTADGCVYTEFYNYAVTFLPLVANVTATTADSTLPMTVNFSANSSGATSWFWNFGNGDTSNLQNPTYVYTYPGPYSFTLIVSNGSCTDTVEYTGVTFGVGTVLPGSGGDSLHVPDPVYSCIPYEMNFNNPALNTVSWQWDFGDGNTSTLENPVHIYTDPGVYTVTLITWDSNGITDTIIQPSAFYLTGSSADFQLTYANNCQGSTVNTTNNSVNAVSYLWDFGDGTTSTQFEPSHVYATVGVNYIVSLTTTDSSGCTDFMARSYYAAAASAVNASSRRNCAGDTVYFTSGAMNFASYLWDFGDGTTSSTPNTWHVYPDSGNYQVTLTVTDSMGCSIDYNLAYPITVSKPVASFTYSINQAPCAGTQVQFTNQSTGASTFIWDFGYGIYSTQTSPVFTFNINASHNVSLIATANGCADTFTVNNLAYFAFLQPRFGYTQSSDCFPVTVTYTDSSHDAVSWFWDFGDGTTSTQQHPVHVFNSAPAGHVTLTVTDINGCVKSLSKPNVNAMVIDVAVSDTVGCSPHTVTFSDSSLNAVSYFWDFGDGTTSTLASPVHTYSGNGNFPVTLTVTAASGCSQTIGPLTQITASGPDAQFSMNSVVSCAPTLVNFFDNSSGASQWIWNFGDNNQSVIENPVHIYNEPGTYDITLTVIDSTGCADTLVRPGLVHITGSVANFTIASSTGCSPWQVQFQDSSISAFSWVWNFGDGTISTQQNPVHTYNTPGSYMVTLMTQDTTGCQSVYSSPVPLNVQQAPVAAFSMSDTAGCLPFTVSMTDLSPAGVTAYWWDFGDGTTSLQPLPTHTYTVPGTYYVTLVVSNASGCTDTVVSQVPITVSLPPVPSFTAGTLTGCSPLPVQFSNTSQNTDSSTTYTWDFGNGITMNADEPYFTYQQAGVYTVALTATNGGGCSASSVMHNYITVTDGSPPPPVALKSVSVDGSHTIEVTWGNLPVMNLAAYKLYRYNPVHAVYDLVYADNNPQNTSLYATTSYTDSVSRGTAHSTYTYVVQAINTCNAETPFEQHIPHTSMNLVDTVINNEVRLAWNPYDGCSVAGYEIYRQDNLQGSFNLVGTVGFDQAWFTDSSMFCGMWAAYRVKAIDLCGEGFSAWSDIEELEAPGILLNQKVDIIRSTVVDDSYVFTEWAPPVLALQLVTEFELYRSADNINFSLIATLPATETSYSDYNTSVHTNSYVYKVKVKNICELQTSQGLPGTSILLQGSIDDENRSVLRWTPYKDWDTGVDYYVIERQDLNGVWQPVRVVDGHILDYIDR